MILALLVGCGPSAPDATTWTPLEAGEPWPDEAGDTIPVPAALAGEDWLADPSAYGRVGLPSGRADAGSFAVGNGRVFGIVGLDDPVNTLTNAIGPGYQADAGFFGDNAFVLDTPVVEARVQRPRGTAIARTWEAGDGVALSVVAFAPPGEDAIVRLVTVDADRAGTLRWSIARADGEPAEAEDGVVQTRGARRTRLSCDVGAVVDDAWEIVFSPGEETFRCVQAFAEGDFPTVAGWDPADAADAAAEMLAGAATLEVPDPKVADLYEGMLIAEWVQSTPEGLVSPMSRYTSGWLRDTEGPVRLWLRAGLHDRALATLEAVWRAQLASGGVRNSFPLDQDLDAVALPDDPEAWWAAADFMPGREPAEAPSYPILLHAAAAGWTGATWDEQRLAFLDACLDRQAFDQDLLPFSGDETFRYPMATAVGALPEELGWSANSTFLWRAAATALGRDPEGAPATPYWTGAYWAPIVAFEGGTVGEPYEDVALQPTWWPGTALDDADVDAHLDAVADTLLRDDGVLLSTYAGDDAPNVGYTGMVPGYWLRAAAARHRPEEADAFAALDLVATPSGHFEELHGRDHRPLALTHAADGLGADTTARYRPWEGGDVVASMLDYLLGAEPDAAAGTLSLAPHLPPGWPAFAARGLRVGDATLDVEVEGYAEGLVVRVAGAETLAVTVELHGERPFSEVWADGVPVDASGDVVRVPARAEVVGAY